VLPFHVFVMLGFASGVVNVVYCSLWLCGVVIMFMCYSFRLLWYFHSCVVLFVFVMLLSLLGIVRLGFNLIVSVIYSPFWLWQFCHVVYCSGVIIVVCFLF
jgi:predicted lysophospholipase L1 biosynthesis ABC-type transport system permease subunit